MSLLLLLVKKTKKKNKTQNKPTKTLHFAKSQTVRCDLQNILYVEDVRQTLPAHFDSAFLLMAETCFTKRNDVKRNKTAMAPLLPGVTVSSRNLIRLRQTMDLARLRPLSAEKSAENECFFPFMCDLLLPAAGWGVVVASESFRIHRFPKLINQVYVTLFFFFVSCTLARLCLPVTSLQFISVTLQ